MRIKTILFLLFTGSFLAGLCGTLLAEKITYGTGTWDAEKYGNHRIILHVKNPADAVWAHIPWRRRDNHPENKNLILVDAKTEKRIKNLFRGEINREFGDIIFQPKTIPGDYYVYYMPNEMTGRSNYPTVIYPKPEKTAETAWLKKHRLNIPGTKYNIHPEASVKAIQSIDEFNSFFPMEFIATEKETRSLIEAYPNVSYILFPENRKYPIRMSKDLPYRWIKHSIRKTLSGDAARGEFYAFQIGVFACREAINNLEVTFSDLASKKTGTIIPASAFQSINTEGINWDGAPFKKIVTVEKGTIQPLWCGIQIPKGVPAGSYNALITVKPDGHKPSSITLDLSVTESLLTDAGDSEPWRHSRLRWLNSRIANDDKIVPPFTPMTVEGKTISCLGRELDINTDGFPKSIRSYFNPEVTNIQDRPRDILAGPIKFIIDTAQHEISGRVSSIHINRTNAGAVIWDAVSFSGPIKIHVQGRMEFDGFVSYKVLLRSKNPVPVRNIRLEIPLVKDAAKYMMGMGRKGGLRPDQAEWKWDQTKNQDAVWLGDVNAGLYASFRAENYSRPLNTNFYLSKPLNMPPSWHNKGRGGSTIKETNAYTVTLTMYSGERTIRPGEDLHFDFILLITPFKPIDTKLQWKTRFYHSYKPIDEIAATGANTINNHHANEVNPYINYPFIHTKQMKTYVDEAHARGLKVKIYNTIRELSNRAFEIFALRSLGDEIFSTGKGGGFSWLQEHLGSDYIAAWFVPKFKDAAIINSGMSRWHNYYLEGLNWLAKNIGIDGIYIDDVAYDRTTMKRVRKILDRNRKGALIDLHSANQFNPRDGYINSALLYMEHFPYINRLWFGEYFDYGSKPDFWLTEVSGIPFGLMGEMLQGGGNAWRGMVFGMTSRLPWAGDPTHIWKVWDDFGMQDSEMFGYWSERCPVKTDNKDILATAYVRKDRVLISIASWAKDQTSIKLKIDWKTLGLDPGKAKLYALEIPDFQAAAEFMPADKIPVEPGKGWLLILK
jgi:hypothetical protein